MEEFLTAQFWIAVGQIVLIAIPLGGATPWLLHWSAASFLRICEPEACFGELPVTLCCA
jgi:hypothetical protein